MAEWIVNYTGNAATDEANLRNALINCVAGDIVRISGGTFYITSAMSSVDKSAGITNPVVVVGSEDPGNPTILDFSAVTGSVFTGSYWRSIVFVYIRFENYGSLFQLYTLPNYFYFCFFGGPVNLGSASGCRFVFNEIRGNLNIGSNSVIAFNVGYGSTIPVGLNALGNGSFLAFNYVQDGFFGSHQSVVVGNYVKEVEADMSFAYQGNYNTFLYNYANGPTEFLDPSMDTKAISIYDRWENTQFSVVPFFTVSSGEGPQEIPQQYGTAIENAIASAGGGGGVMPLVIFLGL
ncbi:MAG: hypothetical protein KatS3mg015_2773 [Fimbriimonadales bacterium]|nr:MAG: hypothetical protein KatS3mg015_2773 [Fimbriimonadales bacterium]